MHIITFTLGLFVTVGSAVYLKLYLGSVTVLYVVIRYDISNIGVICYRVRHR